MYAASWLIHTSTSCLDLFVHVYSYCHGRSAHVSTLWRHAGLLFLVVPFSAVHSGQVALD